jgi:hypothetical protein
MSTAEERKRKRLEAWRNRQTAAAPPPTPAPKVSVSLSFGGLKKKNSKPSVYPQEPRRKMSNPFFADDEQSGDEIEDESRRNKPKLLTLETIQQQQQQQQQQPRDSEPPKKRGKKSRGRWDKAPTTAPHVSLEDALDSFMSKLEAGAAGNVTSLRRGQEQEEPILKINVSGSMVPRKKSLSSPPNPVSGGVITPEELERLSGKKRKTVDLETDAMEVDEDGPRYTQSDWESEASKSEVSQNHHVTLLT